MVIHILGAISGSTPLEGYHHTSIAIETKDSLYWFDAGECCGHTASISGVDLLKTKAIFISHAHMDHIGGLGNLLWYIRKFDYVLKHPVPEDRVIKIFTPSRRTVECTMGILGETEANLKPDYKEEINDVTDGMIFKDDEITVTAIHTNHLPQKNGKWQSYAYRINCEGKTVVFTGDMWLDDLERILPEHTDLLLAETGHHQVEDVPGFLGVSGKSVEKLVYMHIRRDYLLQRELYEKRAEIAFPGSTLAYDGMKIEL